MTTDLPEEARSPQIYYVLAEQWYDHSPTELRTWIDTLGASAPRDAAISGYGRDSANPDPAAAYALILTMGDPTERRKTAGWVMGNWAKKDPEGLRAALPSADISGDDRRRIERILDAASEL